jgi:hypothetical protein
MQCRITFLLLLLLLCYRCGPVNVAEQEDWTRDLPDSIELASVVAAHEEENSLCVFLLRSQDSTEIRKMVIRKGFPPLVFDLTRIGQDFHSEEENRAYTITIDSVRVIHRQKIIHPSSNWQGQTPWAEVQKWSFERLDGRSGKDP